MKNAADHTPIICAFLAAHVRGKQRRDAPPLVIAQPLQVAPHLLCSFAPQRISNRFQPQQIYWVSALVAWLVFVGMCWAVAKTVWRRFVGSLTASSSQRPIFGSASFARYLRTRLETLSRHGYLDPRTMAAAMSTDFLFFSGVLLLAFALSVLVSNTAAPIQMMFAISLLGFAILLFWGVASSLTLIAFMRGTPNRLDAKLHAARMC